jgi:hypothetical protein
MGRRHQAQDRRERRSAANVDTADPGLQQVGECTARIIAAAGHAPAPRGCVIVKPVT